MNESPILLYPNQVQKLLGIGSTKFYELVKLPDFSKPRNLFGGKRSVYLRNEIEKWVTNLAKTEVKKGHGGRYEGRIPNTDTQRTSKQCGASQEYIQGQLNEARYQLEILGKKFNGGNQHEF